MMNRDAEVNLHLIFELRFFERLATHPVSIPAALFDSFGELGERGQLCRDVVTRNAMIEALAALRQVCIRSSR